MARLFFSASFMLATLAATIPAAAQDTPPNIPTDFAPSLPSPPAIPDTTTSPVASDPIAAAPVTSAPVTPEPVTNDPIQGAIDQAIVFLQDGGPSIWAIAGLSVITTALILWKIWRLALIGAWSKGRARRAVNLFEDGQLDLAQRAVAGRMGVRSKAVSAALHAVRTYPEDRAREETTRVARREIANAGTGLRALELIATIAPLLGLLGTVLGMIAAFQALQEAGSRADPALLAGGIWEALLTTAAGMAVAIPASVALTWFEAVIDRIRRDIEDNVTRIFVAYEPVALQLAAE